MKYARITATISALGFLAAIPLYLTLGGYAGLCGLAVGVLYAAITDQIVHTVRRAQREARRQKRGDLRLLRDLGYRP